jgi:hypothetical protein
MVHAKPEIVVMDPHVLRPNFESTHTHSPPVLNNLANAYSIPFAHHLDIIFFARMSKMRTHSYIYTRGRSVYGVVVPKFGKHITRGKVLPVLHALQGHPESG